MAVFDDPFDPDVRFHGSGCSCGRHASKAEHDAAVVGDAQITRVVEQGVMRALFPDDNGRRNFLKAVGATTALAAVSQFFPLGIASEALAQTAKPEKTDLKVGFIPITCATPIIMAHPMGF